MPKPDVAVTEAVQQALDALGGRRPNEIEAAGIFATLGIPTAPSQVIAAPADKVNLAYPVVAKILSADVPHKTDAGGVELRISGDAELEQAATRILANVGARHPDAAVDGILVQQMEQGGLAEVILGFRHDAEVGPIVVLGVGGVLAEIYKDASIRLAPTTRGEARAMIEEVKGLAVIRGYRGMPEGDTEALADAIVSMSQLAAVRGITDAEINPLFVKRKGEGVVAVDGLVIPQSN